MFARKINRSKWNPRPYLKPDAIRADAVTGCLKTKGDRLSMWQCNDNLEDIDQIFLALATGPLITGFDAMDIVVVPENELEDAGFTAEATQGDTAVQDLRSRHVNLVCLDLDKLGTFAKLLASRLKDSQFKRATEAQIKRLVREAAGKGRVQQGNLSEQLRQKLTAPA
jgi:hypothetical protein